jgi:hypothetical protein
VAQSYAAQVLPSVLSTSRDSRRCKGRIKLLVSKRFCIDTLIILAAQLHEGGRGTRRVRVILKHEKC